MRQLQLELPRMNKRASSDAGKNTNATRPSGATDERSYRFRLTLA